MFISTQRSASAMQVVHQSRPVIPRDRFLRLPDVEATTGVKKSTIYMLLRQGKFPKPVRLSSRMVAWPETAVLQWVQDQIAAAAGEVQQ
jgi:prophage regulatory protein